MASWRHAGLDRTLEYFWSAVSSLPCSVGGSVAGCVGPYHGTDSDTTSGPLVHRAAPHVVYTPATWAHRGVREEPNLWSVVCGVVV
jgi:hypothetical protein